MKERAKKPVNENEIGNIKFPKCEPDLNNAEPNKNDIIVPSEKKI